eukprot:scaffold474047_cov26-Prasinocladus_malaysianus.AAC.1
MLAFCREGRRSAGGLLRAGVPDVPCQAAAARLDDPGTAGRAGDEHHPGAHPRQGGPHVHRRRLFAGSLGRREAKGRHRLGASDPAGGALPGRADHGAGLHQRRQRGGPAGEAGGRRGHRHDVAPPGQGY